MPVWGDEITEREEPGMPGRGRPCLVALNGIDAGESFVLGNTVTVVGRDPGAHVRLMGAGISRRHAILRITRDGVTLEDAGSTNGVSVNGVRVSRARLREGDKVFLGRAAFRFSLVDDLEEGYQRRLYDAAQRDDLTHAFNKRYFRDHLEVELRYAARQGTRLAVTVLDLDGLKRVNDGFGHDAGDALLVAFAGRVAAVVREHDIFARLGGDEFAVCTRGTDRDAPRALGDRIVAAAREVSLELGSTVVRARVSAGLAAYPEVHASSGPELMQAADCALYRAKRGGGDRLAVASSRWRDEDTQSRV